MWLLPCNVQPVFDQQLSGSSRISLISTKVLTTWIVKALHTSPRCLCARRSLTPFTPAASYHLSLLILLYRLFSNHHNHILGSASVTYCSDHRSYESETFAFPNKLRTFASLRPARFGITSRIGPGGFSTACSFQYREFRDSSRFHTQIPRCNRLNPHSTAAIMCYQLVELYSECRCLYYQHATDRCPDYGHHGIRKRVIYVGYACSVHSSYGGGSFRDMASADQSATWVYLSQGSRGRREKHGEYLKLDADQQDGDERSAPSSPALTPSPSSSQTSISSETILDPPAQRDPHHPIVWSPEETELGGLKSSEAPGTINGIPVDAMLDWGSSVEAVSEDFATRHRLEIESTPKRRISLLGGHSVEVVGHVLGDFKFQNDEETYPLKFHVLRNIGIDVLLGRDFLDRTETFTKHLHRVVERVRPCVRKGKRLFLINEGPNEMIRCAINGQEAGALPDTGSDLMLVSGAFVCRHKLQVHREKKYRRRVEIIVGSTIWTDGMVLNARLEFDVPPIDASRELDYDQYLLHEAGLSSLIHHEMPSRPKVVFICDFHVIDDLPCDIILSHEFIMRNQVFTRFNHLFYLDAEVPSSEDALDLRDRLLFIRMKRRGNFQWPWRRQLRRSDNASESSLDFRLGRE